MSTLQSSSGTTPAEDSRRKTAIALQVDFRLHFPVLAGFTNTNWIFYADSQIQGWQRF
jgi:hypothetical protein